MKMPIDLDLLMKAFEHHMCFVGVSPNEALRRAIADCTPETDDALRARIIAMTEIEVAIGEQLDRLAASLGLKRKGT